MSLQKKAVRELECVCEQVGHVATEEGRERTECVCEQGGHVATEEGRERTASHVRHNGLL